MVTTRGSTGAGVAVVASNKKRTYQHHDNEDNDDDDADDGDDNASSSSSSGSEEELVYENNQKRDDDALSSAVLRAVDAVVASCSAQTTTKTATSTATGTATTTSKKRPYRRTKRPAGYNDKSSITTTTETFQPVGAYDAVLQESQDLLQAAAEAQQCGRLKMAAAYLLLLHTRLVGLGKRFDRAVAVAERGEQATLMAAANTTTKSNMMNNNNTISSPPSTLLLTVNQQQPQQQQNHHHHHSAAKEALKSILPASVSSTMELDTAMMEHLARAAVELHAARTGKQQHLLAFSPTAREFLAGTANQQGLTNAATVTGVAKAVAAIEQQEAEYWNTATTTHTMAKNKMPGKRNTNNNNNNNNSNQHSSHAANATVEKDVPGRKKPATAAMRTVPHANCDAKALLLHGAPFAEQQQPQPESGTSFLQSESTKIATTTTSDHQSHASMMQVKLEASLLDDLDDQNFTSTTDDAHEEDGDGSQPNQIAAV